jgi:hypothetical protein
MITGKMGIARHHHAGHVLPCLAIGLETEQTQACVEISCGSAE